MRDDTIRLFFRVLKQALGGDSLEELMAKRNRALERGDLEQVRLVDAIVASAVTLGTHAVVAVQSERDNN